MGFRYQLFKLRFSMLSICFLSCQGVKEKDVVEKRKINYTQCPSTPIPAQHVINVETKQIYRISHYWDNFNFKNSLINIQSNVPEQTFVGYIELLSTVPLNEAQKSIDSFMTQAESQKEALVFFENLFEKYLYNPNSSLRNDLFYEFVLRHLLKSEGISNNERARYKLQLQILQKNKPGTKANLFSYWLKSGEMGNLGEIKSPLTLLVFYEPGCVSCEQTLSQMQSSTEINKLINRELLKIVAIYPEGNEQIWKTYQINIPSNWINGLDRDQHILKNKIYDLKASPTIYLLDKNKFVILKDVDFLQVEKFLYNLSYEVN